MREVVSDFKSLRRANLTSKTKKVSEDRKKERTCRKWFQRFKNGDFDIEDRHGDGSRKFSKIPNWRHYLLKTHAKRNYSGENHWERLEKPF